jgi:signal transduction histidine kinase
MKIFIKILLLFLLPAFVHAQLQYKQLDSLHLALKNAANDTLRMDVHSQLGALYLETNRDSALHHIDQSISIAQKLKLKINEAYPLALKGFVLMKFFGNYPKSLQTLLQALKITEDPGSEKNAWIPPSVLIFSGPSPRNYRLDILGYTHLNFGNLYGATGNTDKQIASYFTALSLAESVKDTFLMSVAYLDLGGAYSVINKLDSSLFFLQRALHYMAYLPSEQRKYQGTTLGNIGNIYLQKENFKEARQTFLKAESACKEHNNLTDLGGIYGLMSVMYGRTNKPDSSLFYATKSMEIAQIERQPQYMASGYWLLYFAYRNGKNSDSTLKYLELYSALSDSLNMVERKNLLAYQNVGFDEQIRLQKLEEEKIETQTKIRTYAMLAALAVFFAIGLILYRNNSQKQKANKVLESTLNNLKATQSQLIQSEKMASLGELTAGIAHEIQNPLNFVNNFSEVNKELLIEMKDELEKGNFSSAKNIAHDVIENQEKINHHGKRADAIVKGMLQHSKSGVGVKEPTDINALADEYFRLAYHGLKARDKTFNAKMESDLDRNIGLVNIVPQDIGRVLLNLINNAFYAVTEKREQLPEGFEPTVSVNTLKTADKIEIRVKDNGKGIPQRILDKIFQPFFTTKPTGQGTGLGLSLSYDIIKAHGGELKVETKEGEGSEFVVLLPM